MVNISQVLGRVPGTHATSTKGLLLSLSSRMMIHEEVEIRYRNLKKKKVPRLLPLICGV